MMSVCLLGASGSIGQQTIDVMLKNPKDFDLYAFSVGKRTRYISGILRHFPSVKAVCVQDKKSYKYYQKRYTGITFFFGDDGLNKLIETSNAQMVVNALVGFVGLKPSITALENNKILCLANKESLVVGGEIINNLLKQGKGKLYPIDSEHVAIAKCLAVDNQNVDKIIITASGGPFRNFKRDQLGDITPEQALAHPNWKMGKKITIDSATMVNKTFEVIEAYYLFGYVFEQIEIKINYNSYVHSIVRYNNGTYRADVGKPDMRVPIKYALYQGLTSYQTVLTDNLDRIKNTTFGEFDSERFPIINVANKVIKEKGTLGAIFNASNEEAVRAFLNHQIPFLGIEKIINACLIKQKSVKNPTYEDLKKADLQARLLTKQMILKGGY
ncbi:MAG: 1-deoxy-D-xylulose-5-phosphate reductoisomerase [Bacilli bacterium]|nr:1-deoxy-D-xylulose-5-phosphate reductoisomerase [Bacilli bacterium]